MRLYTRGLLSRERPELGTVASRATSHFHSWLLGTWCVGADANPKPCRRKDCGEGLVSRRPVVPLRRKESWVVVPCLTGAEGHWTSDGIEWRCSLPF